MSQIAPPEERRLNSWKEIAAYFGNDQRTVKRWESMRGLPVRRLPGARSGVFALVSEIEAWQRGEPVHVQSAEPAGSLPDVSIEDTPEAATPTEDRMASAAALAGYDAQAGAEQVGPSDPEPAPASVMAALSGSEHKRGRALWWQTALGFVGIAVVCSVAVWHYDVRGATTPQHVPVPRAKELYLQGRFLWNKRTPDSLRAALADFEGATRTDPQYAAAYAGVADCYALAPQFDPRPGKEIYPRMLAAAKRALELDASSPEGHRALAFALYYWDLNVNASRAEFQQAVRLAPHDAITHLWFANTLATSGQYDKALNEIEQAREIDPTAPTIMADRGWILNQSGRRDEALQAWQRLEQTDPGYTMVHTWLAWLYLDMHRPEEFLKELADVSRLSGRAPDAERLKIARAGMLQGGEPAMRKALADFEEQQYQQGSTGPYSVAFAMFRAGRRNETLEYLERSYRSRDQFVPGLGVSPFFEAMHHEPRFQRLVAASEHPYDEKPRQALLQVPGSSN